MANNNFVVKNGLTVNGSFTANSTAVNASVITATSLNATSVNTATANATTSVVVGANVTISTSTYFVGNATVNTSITGGQLSLSGVTVNSTIYQGTANNSNNFSGLSLATVQSQITGNAASAYSNAVANSAALYQTTAGLSANVATLTSNNSTYHGGVTLATIQSQITGNAASAYSNAINSTVNNATYFSGQLSSYYTNIPARLGYTPANLAGAAFSGGISAPSVTSSSMRLGGGAVYYEGSLAVATYWDGYIRHTHGIAAPSINCGNVVSGNVFADYLRNTSGGAPRLLTADGRDILFQFVDDYANYVRFFRNDGFTNYLMQSPNMRYMDAREWGGIWAMLVQQSDGGNQIFYPAAYSDERLKTNIQPTQVDALAAIAAVEVVEYDWNEDGLAVGNIRNELKHVKVGVIGQQAVEHIPEMFEAGPTELPNGDTEYRFAFMPEKAVPYLIKAIQQQQEMIAALTLRVEALEAATGAGGCNT
jgi:hypothetical protein